MNKFEISYGISGGFGGSCDWEEIQAVSLEDAETQAWENACEVYNSYDGMYGLRTIDEIAKEEDMTEDEATYQWIDNREGWIIYQARETT